LQLLVLKRVNKFQEEIKTSLPKESSLKNNTENKIKKGCASNSYYYLNTRKHARTVKKD